MVAEPLIMLSNYADCAIIIARSLSGVVAYLLAESVVSEEDVLLGSAPDSWELARSYDVDAIYDTTTW